MTAKEVEERGYSLDIKNPHTVAEDHGDPGTLIRDLNKAEADIAAMKKKLKIILSEALDR